MGHRVPQQVRMELHADDGRVLVAECPDAPIRQSAPLPDEHVAAFDRRAALKVGLQCTSGRQRQRHRPLLVALAESEDDRAAPLAQEQVGQFKVDEVRSTAARVQQQVKDGVGPQVLAKLDFPEQSADLAAFQPLGGKLTRRSSFTFLAGFAATCPCSTSQAKYRRSVTGHGSRWRRPGPRSRCRCPESRQHPDRHSAVRERLPVGRAEPAGELP